MQTIIPHIWFDGAAEEAARLYTSMIPGSRIGAVMRSGKAGHEHHGQREGGVMTVEFELGDYRLVGLNGGPQFRPTPSISYLVTLESEVEIDRAWAGLAMGGSVLMPLDAYDWSRRYGWLNDRFGVSWQVSLGNRADVGQAVAPALLFCGPNAGQAEEAVSLYTSVFPGSQVEGVLRHDGSGADPAGTVMHAQFRLGGETFTATDSALAHDFGFTEANSLLVVCETQDEIDRYWGALSADPRAERCGWLKDRFGVSWQIVPRALHGMLSGPDHATAERVMGSLMQMGKLDIAALERAYAG